MLDPSADANALPGLEILANDVRCSHGATTGSVDKKELFYMMQRGLSQGEAMSLAVNGFVNELMKAFPMEYSVELKRLIDMEMEGSVG